MYLNLLTLIKLYEVFIVEFIFLCKLELETFSYFFIKEIAQGKYIFIKLGMNQIKSLERY